MEQRYNVLFAGQVLDGHELTSVRKKLAQVFKTDQQTLEKLFSGKAQLIKRDCDKATALKFKAAMEAAGALPIIQAVAADERLSAAEKIAALAATPDENPFGSTGPEGAATDSAATQPGTHNDTDEFDIAPPGADVLREDERTTHITREVDTAGLEVDTAATRLSRQPPAPPAAPDTSHLNLDVVGATIPNLPSAQLPLSPNTDAITLAPDGTDLKDCAAPAAPVPELDISGIEVAPTGAELTEKKYRRRDPPAAPPTEHLSLEKSV